MAGQKKSFRYESLQDKDSIQDMLKSLAKAIAKGELTFSDEEEQIVMHPKDLLNVKLVASENDAHKRIDLRISWYSEEKAVKKAKLKVE
jgi:amphi-Trp domain-containing protein